MERYKSWRKTHGLACGMKVGGFCKKKGGLLLH